MLGPFNNPFGHGHDYVLQVVTRGPVDSRTGQLLNLDGLDEFVGRILLQEFQYCNLNDLDEFKTLVPTTENLALVAELGLAQRRNEQVSEEGRHR
jgi:6-pyruvoyltetrahydropterin/6-carboxytetrahydropterin synthase